MSYGFLCWKIGFAFTKKPAKCTGLSGNFPKTTISSKALSAMSLANLGAFGGTLKINEKEYAVRGRTYRKIAEQMNWWISECFCPVIELRILLVSFPEVASEEFVLHWLKKSRQAMFSDGDLQSKVLSTFAARRFDIWQACRDDGLKLEDLDAFLDELDGPGLRSFFEEADKKMALANGVSELEYLSNCFSRTPPNPGAGGGSVEAMLAQVCVHSKNRIQIHELLDCTPSAIRALFQDPEAINANSALDGPIHQDDKIGQKRVSKILSNASKNIMEGKRIDAYREPAAKPKTGKAESGGQWKPPRSRQAISTARLQRHQKSGDPSSPDPNHVHID